MLGFFLAGGLLTTTALGLAIVLSLGDTSLFTGSRPPAPPAVNITVGILALVVAVVVPRRKRRTAGAAKEPTPKQRPWTERMLDRDSGRIAFLVGIVINLVPGFFAVVGYTNIARLNYGTAETIAFVVCFNLIMFSLVEVPLVGYLVAPRRTADAVTRLNAWLRGHGERLITVTATVVGVYLIVRGILELVV